MDALPRLHDLLAGRYTLQREIGRGGMATVYLARDIRHDRDVALKLLNPELGAALGVERFLSEIRVTANLQHPNLLPLFDSGDADGLLYYVMPYIAGGSLGAKLAREKQLPIEEAIHLATAIASALDYTHRHGVIHRDLKPENILLHEGQPLIADFGIALAVSNTGNDRITQTGLSLGTPQYMSPEQAIGDREIDSRTDMYSLGVITYEMLTAEPPHTGRSAQAIIARILTDPVRGIRSSRASVPAHVEHAVMRALEKLPADRWATAHEFADALQGRGAPVTSPRGVQTAAALHRPLDDTRTGASRRRSLAMASAFVAVVAIAVAATWRILAHAGGAEGSPSLSFMIDPPILDGVRQTTLNFAISPDGKTLAILAHPFDQLGSRVYLRRLSEPSPAAIPGTEGATYAAFSPDGKWLSITTFSGKLLRVRVDGTTAPITLADGVDGYTGAVWADNETLVLGSVEATRTGLGRIAATGGAIRPLTTPKAATTHAFPFVAPDGETVLFVETGPGFYEDDFLALGSLETGLHQTSTLLAFRPVGVTEGRAIYMLGTSIMAVPIDAKRLRVTGPPVRVFEDVTMDGRVSAVLSPGGTLAYRRGQPRSRLILLDRDGRTQTLSSDEHFIWPYGDGPRFSPDGQRIAFAVWEPSGDTAAADIWTFDVKRRTFTRVTTLGNVSDPYWSGDGKRLMFSTSFPRNATLWSQMADGSQSADRLLQAPAGTGLYHASATPDGLGVVFCRGVTSNGAGTGMELLYLPFAGSRTPVRLTNEPLSDTCIGRVSPDGKWLAYVGLEAGTPQVFVRRFRGGGGRLKVSEESGQQPTWSRDGTRLFYASVSASDKTTWAMAATVAASGTMLSVVNRERIAALPSLLFDVTPDGTRILAVQQSDSRVQLFVTTNWLPQLRARVAGRE